MWRIADSILRLWVFSLLSKSFSHNSLVHLSCWKPGQQTQLTVILSDTPDFLFPRLSLDPATVSLKVCCYDNCLAEETAVFCVCVAFWNVCECAWMQTGSQTVVPADSCYRRQGRLNRDEQINYRLCVRLIKSNKTRVVGRLKHWRLFVITWTFS